MQIRSVFINTTRDIGDTGGFAADINWALIYISLTLVTTLLCTLLIVYRIVRLASGVSSYGNVVEIVIESSAMYSLTLIVYLALVARNLESSYYADMIMAYIKVSLRHIYSFQKLNFLCHGRLSPLPSLSDASQRVRTQTLPAK